MVFLGIDRKPRMCLVTVIGYSESVVGLFCFVEGEGRGGGIGYVFVLCCALSRTK